MQISLNYDHYCRLYCKNKKCKLSRFKLLMIETNCASFTKIWLQMQTVSHKQEMQIVYLKWLLFPYRLSNFFQNQYGLSCWYRQTVQVLRKSDHKCRLVCPSLCPLVLFLFTFFPLLDLQESMVHTVKIDIHLLVWSSYLMKRKLHDYFL